MQYHTTDPYGVTRIAPPPEAFIDLIEEAASADDVDDPDISLVHASGLCLTYYPRRQILAREAETAGAIPQFVTSIDPHTVANLWRAIALGNMNAADSLDWLGDVDE